MTKAATELDFEKWLGRLTQIAMDQIERKKSKILDDMTNLVIRGEAGQAEILPMTLQMKLENDLLGMTAIFAVNAMTVSIFDKLADCSATLRNAPQRSATLRNAPQRSATLRNAPQRSATLCNALQRSATLRNAK
jgi:hypothetical protein